MNAIDLSGKCRVPAGKRGNWVVEKFVVSKQDVKLNNLRAMISFSARPIKAGSYTRLVRTNGFRTVVMSDTPVECDDLSEVIDKATGNVLINGLGLGLVADAVLQKTDVEHVTVIEFEEDVIKLVGDFYKKKYGDRLTIIHADAFAFKPNKNAFYDVVWHDIWDDICSDNLKEMGRLHRKYARRCGWQGSWCKGECRILRR